MLTINYEKCKLWAGKGARLVLCASPEAIVIIVLLAKKRITYRIDKERHVSGNLVCN